MTWWANSTRKSGFDVNPSLHLDLSEYDVGRAARSGGYHEADFHVWCGSVVAEEDGRYHMFASRWSRQLPFTCWATSSEIVRAVADHPSGPFRFQEVVLAGRDERYFDGRSVHNPVICRNPASGYALFYTATTFARPLDLHRPAGQRHFPQWLEAWNSQRIGVATSDSVLGPWRRRDEPILEPRADRWDASITSNPAVTLDDKGEWVLIYKSIAKPYVGDALPARFQFGLCRASSPAGPYRRESEEPLFADHPQADLEDPFIWHNGTCFEMLAKDMNGAMAGTPRAGVHAWSHNARQWQLAPSPCFYDRTVQWDDGTQTTQDFLERVWLLREEGRPSHLYFATAESPEGYFGIQNARNIAVPLIKKGK